MLAFVLNGKAGRGLLDSFNEHLLVSELLSVQIKVLESYIFCFRVRWKVQYRDNAINALSESHEKGALKRRDLQLNIKLMSLLL